MASYICATRTRCPATTFVPSELGDGGKTVGTAARTAVRASRVPAFCRLGQASLPTGPLRHRYRRCHILCPQAGTPCPTAKFGRTGNVQRKKSYAPLFETLTSVYSCQAARKTRPLLVQCKQKVVREKHLGGAMISAIPLRESWQQQRGTTKVGKVATSEVARVSRGAVSPFIPTPKSDVAGEATCLCTMSLQHLQRRRRRRSRSTGAMRVLRLFGAKTHESNEIAPVMWGVVTRVRPAPSTQTIENKSTILRHRARGPRKTEISPYM